MVETATPASAPASTAPAAVARLAATTAASANAAAMTSTWAPSTATPKTSGFRVHSRSTRPPEAPARSIRARTPSHATTTSTCQTQTVSRMLVPPGCDASACSIVAAGP